MIVTPAEMKAIEEEIFATGVTAESLMEAVGERIARRVERLSAGRERPVICYAGKGNNAGDVLVAARVLEEARPPSALGNPVLIRLAFADAGSLGELPRRKLEEAEAAGARVVSAEDAVRGLTGRERPLVLDGLLGIGATGALRGPIKELAREINALRREHGAEVLAADVPTGIDGMDGAADPDAVVADETLTVGFPKVGLVDDGAVNHVGRLHVVHPPEFDRAKRHVHEAAARGMVTTAAALRPLLPPRPHESNKGMFGRVGIIAGSVGATGAAIMCAHACARAGAGLITLLTHPDIYPIVAGAASPEIMVRPLPTLPAVMDMGFDVLGLGPGLGQENNRAVCELIARWPKPMVVDADGLNALAKDMGTLKRCAGPRLLTPHPGEMKRLLAGCDELRSLARDGHSRQRTAREFTDLYPVTLLLKGARTVVAERGRPLAYNSTGNPGMATGGMGDVLTGICCALAGQKLSLFDAACAGAWLHGEAADIARGAGQSEQSLLPLDMLASMGAAFDALWR